MVVHPDDKYYIDKITINLSILVTFDRSVTNKEDLMEKAKYYLQDYLECLLNSEIESLVNKLSLSDISLR